MESGDKRPLVGSDIHGFHTLEDLDYGNILEEARSRWLRPNEIHAILSNHKYFTIHVRPMNLPKSGTIVLFDRKMLRNFRKDGHNWKKKNDGKTVKEAHEHLKVGNEERIHVYYAHGQDNPTFVRRCYWLLDKALEHIVLVHYRETQESQGSPVTPLHSNSGSVSDQSIPWPISEEFESGTGSYAKQKEHLGSGNNLNINSHAMRLHELNTLEWDDLVANDLNNSTVTKGDKVFADQQNQIPENGSLYYGGTLPPHNLSVETSSLGNVTEPVVRTDNTCSSTPNIIYNQASGFPVNSNAQQNSSSFLGAGVSLDILANDGLQNQDSFGRWMNYIIADSPSSMEDVIESSISSGHDSVASSEIDQHQSPAPEQIFVITDVSPGWAFSTETTKVLITGYFHDRYLQLAKSNLFCICGDASVPVACVQAGVYRCLLSPHIPGLASLCLSLDGHNPISQILNFEYRSPPLPEPVVSSEDKSNWEGFQLQLRLAHLLFSTSKSLDIFSSKISPASLRDAKKFSKKVSGISNSWIYLTKLIEEKRISVTQAKDGLFEITLKNLLKEWLLERVVEGCKSTEYDAQGQGVIHLCSILGYAWAIYLFSWSGLSLDFRDKHGWTALHWAAYHGREKMVAVLLSAGAKPNLVTDPTTDNPGGCTAADLASRNGFDGLAAYLSEKALVAHFKDMSMAGNASGLLETATEAVNSENLTEDELYFKDTLAAYRTAADAAAHIQSAFREHSLKVRSKSVQASNPEDEARSIIAAMKIQHAFRDYDRRKKMAAAFRIQYRFRTWKLRKDFLNMRRHAIKIQAAFRGFQARKQYQKIVWSVGVLEKAILRWRLRRKGFRGLQIDPIETAVEPEGTDAEEGFYKTSQKQAEERVVRSVTRVQALFRSKKAQAEYQRIKLAHTQAMLEFEGLETDLYMGTS